MSMCFSIIIYHFNIVIRVVLDPMDSTDSQYTNMDPDDIGPILHKKIAFWPYLFSLTPDFTATSSSPSNFSVHSVMKNMYSRIGVFNTTTAITISGVNFFAGVKLYVGEHLVPDNQTMLLGSHTLLFQPPPSTTVGYVDLRVVNPDGGYRLIPQVLYYTDQCLLVGYYGPADGCLPCPPRAICPGKLLCVIVVY